MKDKRIKTMTVTVTEKTASYIQNRAIKEDRTVSWIINNIQENYIDSHLTADTAAELPGLTTNTET